MTELPLLAEEHCAGAGSFQYLEKRVSKGSQLQHRMPKLNWKQPLQKIREEQKVAVEAKASVRLLRTALPSWHQMQLCCREADCSEPGDECWASPQPEEPP